MLLNKLTRWVLAMVCVAGLCGCAKKSEPTVKTDAQYKAEAEKQINEENADAELQKLEQSISQDAAQTQ
jgi:type IV pilus biogenesis protein CpaD/CtpE